MKKKKKPAPKLPKINEKDNFTGKDLNSKVNLNV